MRLFFALWPDDAVRMHLAALQQDLKGRKTRHGNLHMTLAFLGEQPESLLPALQELLDGLTVPNMTLTIDHIAYRIRQRMIWASMQNAPDALYELQHDICAGLKQCGIAFDGRHRFTPHVTLARDATPMESFHFAPIAWRACQVSLVQSVAETSGVAYQVLASQYCNDHLKKE